MTLNHRCCPSLHIIAITIAHSTQNEITQQQIQRQISSLSSVPHNSRPKLLGFIDDLKDELTLQTLHGKVIKDGSVVGLDVRNYILSLYAKFKDLGAAQKVFDEMTERDVRTWTILVSGFARIGSFRAGVDSFSRMVWDGICPNGFTLSSVLKCCSNAGFVSIGKAIHGWILRNGTGLDAILKNSMLDFYVKSDKRDYAKRLFELTDGVNTVAWNIMIGEFLRNGNLEDTLDLFRKLPSKDVATWNTVISGLMRNGSEETALQLLYEMVKAQSCFDEYTFTISLSLVSLLSLLELGEQIHGRLIRLRLYDDKYITSSLIDMYSKCGAIGKTSLVFKKVAEISSPKPNSRFYGGKVMVDAVSCSSMISGYAQNGRWPEALEMFCNMVHEGIEVDKFIVTTIVSVCADYGLMDFGQQIHAFINKTGYELDLVLSSSLVDMYSKCGSLDQAQLIFDQTTTRNTVLWTILITGYALHGHGREAVRLLGLMTEEGIQPNDVTFVAVLTACSHGGLVDEGRKYFKLMTEVYGIKPGVEHFTCMVDLFGRAGRLDKIKNFIYDNGISHLSSVWRAFLSSCRVHKNYDMGKWVSQKLLELEPMGAEPYVLLSNMCATSSRWEESATVRGLMQKKGLRKHPGQSWIELNSQVHTFAMGDRSNPQEAEIYSYLDSLVSRLKEIGYCVDVEQVMQNVEEEQREIFLRCHSEKLAVVYGIISTGSSTPIRVMKNLRVCSDCHNFLKYTSLLLGREIIVRDIRRFHNFKNGLCSCGDYW